MEEEFEPRYLKERAVRVSIFLNVFDVHINRIPCDGIIENVQYQPGLFLVASKPHATLQNEQNAVMIKTAEGAKVLCVQVAGLIARRIVWWVNPKDRAVRGERYGLIRFGSRMDTYVPVGTAIRIAVGDRVKGGRDNSRRITMKGTALRQSFAKGRQAAQGRDASHSQSVYDG